MPEGISLISRQIYIDITEEVSPKRTTRIMVATAKLATGAKETKKAKKQRGMQLDLRP